MSGQSKFGRLDNLGGLQDAWKERKRPPLYRIYRVDESNHCYVYTFRKDRAIGVVKEAGGIDKEPEYKVTLVNSEEEQAIDKAYLLYVGQETDSSTLGPRTEDELYRKGFLARAVREEWYSVGEVLVGRVLNRLKANGCGSILRKFKKNPILVEALKYFEPTCVDCGRGVDGSTDCLERRRPYEEP